jgi:hypothetical protein
MEDRAASRVAAIATGSAASALAAVSIAWWLDPRLADATGDAVMIIGFMLALGGIGLVLALAYDRGATFAREGLSTP